MYKKLGIAGIMVISMLALAFFDSSAQVLRQEKKDARSTVAFGKHKNQMVIRSRDGRTIIIKGCWTEENSDQLKRSMERLEDVLNGLDARLQNLETPDPALLEHLKNFDARIGTGLGKMLESHDRKEAELRERFRDLDDFRIDLDLSCLDKIMHDLENIEVSVSEIRAGLPDIEIKFPEIEYRLESLEPLEIILPGRAFHERFLQKRNWDRGSIQDQKHRPGIQ